MCVYVLSIALDCVIYVSLMMMMMQDFSFVMREYRLFFVKLPNGLMCREIFNITKPISELREKLCDHIGAGRFLIGSKKNITFSTSVMMHDHSSYLNKI